MMLIVKESLEERIDNAYEDGRLNSVEDICAIIADLPQIDAVPVVRCRDCRHAHKAKDCEVYKCAIDHVYKPDIFFCMNGERRTE